MMRLITRFGQLSAFERALFFRALAVIFVIRIALRLLPYRVVRYWVEHYRQSVDPRCEVNRRNIPQVAWAIAAASRRIPGTTCLPQGMAAHLLLGRLGQPSELRLGVALNSEGSLEAHAWVEVAGRVVSGG